ncbi:Perchlorate reductase subunit gamma precursor [Posidoniimonas corsicana]|uniref:Perchlorate reductase subunit gamma n=1 Tax=Posidoniimonas corsicana TaxID=1938618 RepID=A0A5C5UXY9_9BACT|nr:Perchlorate reductase subunit gamma precursor [Posidoniimonas corsicana]
MLGDDACAKCHQQEINQWRLTPHYRTFDVLHRKPEAKEIADKLGLRSVKRNDTCVRCHYTQQEQRPGRVRVVAGVSCESCHGAAADWVNLHADYGGPNATKSSESPQHKQHRREASVAAGMNNPSDIYLIARQCLGCHTTPDEQLVNVGGHNAGSQGFELVSWSQGMVRHNFQRTDGHTNAPSSVERLRVMYLVGAMADLEMSLRAAAKATTASTFGQTAAARAARVKQRLWEAQRRLDDRLLAKALDAVSDLQLTLDNSEAIVQAADRVGRVAQEFSRTADGATLGAIDPLLPPPGQYKN